MRMASELRRCWVLSAAVVFLLLARPLSAGPGVRPLTPAARRALAGIAEDPAPPKLLNNQHYVVSDEATPERFREAIAGLGGMAIGVGTDQNYLFAGWARSELLVLFDFDPVVVDLHAAYRVFFLHAPDPKAFIELWAPGQATKTSELLTRALSQPDERQRVEQALRISRHLVWARLGQMRQRYQARGIPSYLNEQAQYDHLVALFRAGRVRAIRGDVTGANAMNSLAKVARQLGEPVQLLYLSNVEQYVRYGDGFRRNILALPLAERSLLLRTYHPGGKQNYYYFVQGGRDFQGWLQRSDVRGLADVLWRPGTQWRAPLVWLAGPDGTTARN